MSTTTARVAPSSVDPETTHLDTSPVASAERSYATLAGRDSTALNVSGFGFVRSLNTQKTHDLLGFSCC